MTDTANTSEQKPRKRSTSAAAVRMRRLRDRQRRGIMTFQLTPNSDWRDVVVRLGLISETDSWDTVQT